jgi:protein transport protein SEC31
MQYQTPLVDKFQTIAWGPGYNNDYHSGIIAGGMNDGSLMLWNASEFLQNNNSMQTGDNTPLLAMDLYGAFNCLEFNPFKPELIATGGEQCCLVDLGKDPSNPEVTEIEGGTATTAVTSVSWNPTLRNAHILACAHEDGTVNIVDMRNFGDPRKKSIVSSFKDKVGKSGREVVAQWNPASPTQIATVVDDP